MLPAQALPRDLLENSTYNRMLASILEQFWANPPLEIDFNETVPAMDSKIDGVDVTLPVLTHFFEGQFYLLFGTSNPYATGVGEAAIPIRLSLASRARTVRHQLRPLQMRSDVVPARTHPMTQRLRRLLRHPQSQNLRLRPAQRHIATSLAIKARAPVGLKAARTARRNS